MPKCKNCGKEITDEISSLSGLCSDTLCQILGKDVKPLIEKEISFLVSIAPDGQRTILGMIPDDESSMVEYQQIGRNLKKQFPDYQFGIGKTTLGIKILPDKK